MPNDPPTTRVTRITSTIFQPVIRFLSVVRVELLAFSVFGLFQSLFSPLTELYHSYLPTILNQSHNLPSWFILSPSTYTLAPYYNTIIQSSMVLLTANLLYYLPYTIFSLVFLAFLFQLTLLATHTLSSAAVISHHYLIQWFKTTFYAIATSNDATTSLYRPPPKRGVLTARAGTCITSRSSNPGNNTNTPNFETSTTPPSLTPSLLHIPHLITSTYRPITKVPVRIELPLNDFTAVITAMEDTLAVAGHGNVAATPATTVAGKEIVQRKQEDVSLDSDVGLVDGHGEVDTLSIEGGLWSDQWDPAKGENGGDEGEAGDELFFALMEARELAKGKNGDAEGEAGDGLCFALMEEQELAMEL